MRLILETTNSGISMMKANCIRDITSAIKNRKLKELHLAIAYNSIYDDIEEFWYTIIQYQVETHFYFLCNSSLPINIDLLDKIKDYSFIHWYPIKNNFHCKIIHAPNIGTYIGSANMSENGWLNNFESGVWLQSIDKEIEPYLKELKLCAFSNDKEQIYQLYTEYMNKFECIKQIEKQNQEIFDDILKQNNIYIDSFETDVKMNKFESDIDQIYGIFFNEIYPEIEEKINQLPRELQKYPLSYITDQILLIVREKQETTSTTISEAIYNLINNTLEYFTIDDLVFTCEGYEKNYRLLKEIGNTTMKLTNPQIRGFVENIHSVTSDKTKTVDELINISTKPTKMGKSFTDMLRYLVLNQQDPIAKRFYETSRGVDYKMNGIGEGRVGEIIGLSRISSGYKDYDFPILNGGVITSLVELKKLPTNRKNKNNHWIR